VDSPGSPHRLQKVCPEGPRRRSRKPTQEFWGDSTCTKRCVCNAEYRKAVCQWASCRAEEECRVEDGIRGCYPKSHATCAAVGATHYESFDGGKFIFQGTCMYQLAGLCEKSRGLVDFQVLVQNGRQDAERLSSIALVMVKVYEWTLRVLPRSREPR
uniref:VWFD domain-containing protein n=1 Tax=Strix occidentalis caurina TaxID=311401 RepID=A0A8D0F6J6_STROC